MDRTQLLNTLEEQYQEIENLTFNIKFSCGVTSMTVVKFKHVIDKDINYWTEISERLTTHIEALKDIERDLRYVHDHLFDYVNSLQVHK